MRLRATSAGLLVTVIALLSACNPSEDQLRKELLNDPEGVAQQIADGFQKDVPNAVTRDQAVCVGRRLVNDFDSELLLKIGFGRIKMAQIPASEQQKFAALLSSCLGEDGVAAVISEEFRSHGSAARAGLVQGLMSGSSGLINRTQANCVADHLIDDEGGRLLAKFVVNGPDAINGPAGREIISIVQSCT